MTSIYDKVSLREKDLSPRSVWIMRFSVTLFTVCSVAVLLLVDFLGLDTPLKFGFYGVLAISMLVTAFNMCFNRVWWRIGFPTHALDEWEQRLKTKMSVFGYKVAFATVIMFVIVTTLAESFGITQTFDVRALFVLALIFTILIVFSPMVYLAWIIRPMNED